METAREFTLRKYPELWGKNHNAGDIIRAMEEYAEMVAKNIVAKPVLCDSGCDCPISNTDKVHFCDKCTPKMYGC